VNDHLLPHHRRPVVIADSKLSAGAATTRLKDDDPEALLRQYLRLIRRVRSQQRDRSVALRRVDIVALAEHLGWAEGAVLARLADLMGATRRQRSAMLAILATGASLITVAGPLDAAVAAPPETGAVTADDPVVVLSDHLANDDRPSAEHAARVVPSDEPIAGSPRIDRARHAPVLEARQRRGDPVPSVQIDRDTPPDSSPPDQPTPVTAPPQQSAVVQSEVVPMEPDEGSPAVAVGQPPVPPATDTHGNTVAVGQPPVPASEPSESGPVEPAVPPVDDV